MIPAPGFEVHKQLTAVCSSQGKTVANTVLRNSIL